MGRVYGEPVAVQARADGRPDRFIWRGRYYVVRAVAEHWVDSCEWWRAPETVPDRDGTQFPRPETECWRVTAAAGQGMPAGSYELRRDTAVGVWSLYRVAD
jgi:hypothetical protein